MGVRLGTTTVERLPLITFLDPAFEIRPPLVAARAPVPTELPFEEFVPREALLPRELRAPTADRLSERLSARLETPLREEDPEVCA